MSGPSSNAGGISIGEMMALRILWHSNAPVAATGYGVQSGLFGPYLKEIGHEVTYSAYWGSMARITQWNGFTILPGAHEPWGNDILAAHAGMIKADVLITLMDTWVLAPPMFADAVPWYPWTPVDHDPLPPKVGRSLVAGQMKWPTKPIAMSRFGQRVMEEAGISSYYVPHGYDQKVYSPGNKSEARKYLSELDKLEYPDSAYIIGMVAANRGVPSRKAFPQQIEAVSMFMQSHSDVLLYLHTNRDEFDGVNLDAIIQHFGIGKRVIWVDQHRYHMGAIPPEEMAQRYRMMDVLLNVSMGEGFGIPILEAQACGTPALVGDWSAMPEIGKPWTMSKHDAISFWTGLNSFMWLPRPRNIMTMLECIRRNQPTRPEVHVQGYGANHVTLNYWKPVLDDIAKTLAEFKPEVRYAEAVKV